MRSLLVLALLATSCVSVPPAPIAWTRDLIVGYEFTSVDPKVIEWWSFDGNGSVIATLGTTGGGAMGPVWDWRIHAGKLQIYDGTQLWDEWTLLRRDPQTITVRRKPGDITQYRYSRQRKT